MKLGIAMTTELCYTSKVEMNASRGVLLLSAVDSTQYHCGQSAPYQVDSRPAVHLDNDGKPVGGRFVMKQCSECKEWKDPSAFSKCKVSNDGLRGNCRGCDSIRWKLWYQANKEKKKQLDTDYRKANPEKKQEYGKRYRAKNPGRSTENARRWREDNPEKSKAKNTKDSRTWRENNPEKNRAKWHKRQAQKLGNGGSYTADEWQALCDRYDNKCLACGECKPLTVDHVVPVSKGGSNDISNIQPLCGSCNTSKKDRTIDYRY